jgi:N-acetyl-alpha-D-muramate 1-phosphate uridylyltransferase
MKAMILAAGLGTRLKPWTDHHPKALAIVNGKSLLQRNVQYLMQCGINDIVVNVHHFADQIRDAIIANDAWGANISISDETEEVLETGGGLLKAYSYLKGSDQFILLNVDILTDMNLKDIVRQHQLNDAVATIAVTRRESSRAFLFDEDMRLRGWHNTTTGEQKLRDARPAAAQTKLEPFAFSGIHLISERIFDDAPLSGKFSMVDWYLEICGKHTILGYNHHGSHVLDVGKPESIAKAEAIFA